MSPPPLGLEESVGLGVGAAAEVTAGASLVGAATEVGLGARTSAAEVSSGAGAAAEYASGFGACTAAGVGVEAAAGWSLWKTEFQLTLERS
jgi:hypothetical protein